MKEGFQLAVGSLKEQAVHIQHLREMLAWVAGDSLDLEAESPEMPEKAEEKLDSVSIVAGSDDNFNQDEGAILAE